MGRAVPPDRCVPECDFTEDSSVLTIYLAVPGSVVPLLASLAPIHEFTVETQVQYFAPLAVELHRKDGEEGTYVDEADLRAFVNNAEWNLGERADLFPSFCSPGHSSLTSDPVSLQLRGTRSIPSCNSCSLSRASSIDP